MSSERPTLAELADELEAEKPCGGYTAANAIALSPDTVALLAARLREADEALAEIERGEGPFSVDHHQFAKNVIEAMKGRARRARGGEHG